jgi:hypothetical protein
VLDCDETEAPSSSCYLSGENALSAESGLRYSKPVRRRPQVGPLALRHELRTMVQSPAYVGATPACDRLPQGFIGSQKCNPCAWELLLPMSLEHTMSSPSPGGEGRGEGESTTINPLRVSIGKESGPRGIGARSESDTLNSQPSTRCCSKRPFFLTELPWLSNSLH